MGQQDVKKVLKKEGTWLISNEIAKKAGYSLKSIQSSVLLPSGRPNLWP